MRSVSLEQIPTAILSPQTAGTRGHCLIVNLPGRPSAMDVCLNAVFPAFSPVSTRSLSVQLR